MGLVNASILTGASISASGGTAVNYTPDGQSVPNGLHLIDAAVADFRLRPQLTFKTKNPTLMPDGSYSKDRRTVVLVEPFVDSKGKTQFDLIRIEREVHPESPAAKALDLNKKGAQLLIDTDTAAFFASGSLA